MLLVKLFRVSITEKKKKKKSTMLTPTKQLVSLLNGAKIKPKQKRMHMLKRKEIMKKTMKIKKIRNHTMNTSKNKPNKYKKLFLNKNLKLKVILRRKRLIYAKIRRTIIGKQLEVR